MFDKILNLINEIQVDIHFVWIPSHFKANERLDRLAQNATKTRLLKISIWNSLPANIRQCNSLPTFKRHLKTHLFTHS